MVKKGIYNAADKKMKKASKYRKVKEGIPEFNFEFYKITCKYKLKQLELDLEKNKLIESPEYKFDKLIEIFQKEKMKYELDEISFIKFDFLTI